MNAVLVLWMLAADPVKSTIPCETVAQCWLDESGSAMARPKSKKGHAIPRGNCGKNLFWLRNRLTCEEGVCVSQFIGDKC